MDGAPKTPEHEIAAFGSDTKIALKALAQFNLVDDFDALWSALKTYASDLGVDLLSYNHRAPEFAPDHENVTFLTHGFPDDWGQRYASEKLHLTDPVAQMLSHSIRPARWSDIGRHSPISPKQQAYIDEVRAWMTGEGYGMPTFGPSGRQGYVGFGSSHHDLSHWGPLAMNRIQWVAQSFHLRWCELVLLNLPQDFQLDERELNILKSMSLGMSDEIMCGVIGAQVESVRRSIRNILKKMGVSDRPSAILRGMGAGLLDAETSVLRRV